MRTFVCYVLLLNAVLCLDLTDILNERNALLDDEYKMMLGSDILLSDSEIKVNDIFMELKQEDLLHGFHNPEDFHISKHFFDYKDKVKKTKLFKLIEKMPKGAVLHAHDTGILSPDYVVHLTYYDDLYVCFKENGLSLQFSIKVPSNSTCEFHWQLMQEVRYCSGDVEKFDAELRRHFTLLVDNPRGVYPDVNAVWRKFQHYFITTGPLFSYKPVWEQYFYDTLKALREDNVMYLEIRSVLPQLYDLNGNSYDSLTTAESYKDVLDKFMADYPDFFGAKLIYAPLRSGSKETIDGYIEIAKRIKKAMPDFFAGFDLVGQEDLGKPLVNFMPALVKAADELDFFFHGGETNWYGTSSDENLADAIVLGSKRIGHGYALAKHPLLLEEVKKRDIGIEVNVISNAVLKLVDDVRNHPLAYFLSQDLPVVLSSDDPGLWEADPLSHDFYVTFVGVASRKADLRLLKRLALNSLYYSCHSHKFELVHEFEIRWTKFINTVVRDSW